MRFVPVCQQCQIFLNRKAQWEHLNMGHTLQNLPKQEYQKMKRQRRSKATTQRKGKA